MCRQHLFHSSLLYNVMIINSRKRVRLVITDYRYLNQQVSENSLLSHKQLLQKQPTNKYITCNIQVLGLGSQSQRCDTYSVFGGIQAGPDVGDHVFEVIVHNEVHYISLRSIFITNYFIFSAAGYSVNCFDR